MNANIAQSLLTQNKKTYNSIAKNFSLTRNKNWTESDFFIKNFIKDGDTILDVGCGNGRLFGAISDNKTESENVNPTFRREVGLTFSYIGIDVSKKLIDEAKKQFINTKYSSKFLVEDILNPSPNFIEKNRFDVAFAIAVLNHIPSPNLRKIALNNIFKLLKPRGYLLMTNWNLWNISSKKNWWRLKISACLNGKNNPSYCKIDFKDIITHWGQKKLPLYYRCFTKKEIKKLLQQSGFKIIDNFYSLNGKKTVWWKAKNLVTISQKIKN